MGNPINLGLRGLQFLWTFLILALTGNMIHDAIGGNPSVVNYVMFVAVFTMIALIYLVAASISPSLVVSPFLMVLMDGLCTLFFLAGGIALGAKLHVHSCGNVNYTRANGITKGALNTGKRCHEAQAVTVFLWFGFISFLGSFIFSALSARSGGITRGGTRQGAPAMSQA